VVWQCQNLPWRPLALTMSSGNSQASFGRLEVPARVDPANPETNVAVLKRTYSRYIADYADALVASFI